MTTDRHPARHTRVLLLGIILVSIAIYLPSINHPFIWDDEGQIVENDILRAPDALRHLLTSSTFDTGGGNLAGVFYRPLVSIWNYYNFQSWQLDPAGYRLLQILPHLLAVLFVYKLVKSILSLSKYASNETISLFAALIYAIHPINVESVVYIGAIGEILYTLIGLIGLLMLARHLKQYPNRNIRPATLVYFCLLVLGSMLAKESGVIFLLIGCVLLGLFSVVNAKQWKHYIIACITTVLTYLWLRLHVAEVPFANDYPSAISQASLTERLLTLPYILTHYIQVLIAPIRLTIYDNTVVTSITSPVFYIPFLTILAVTYASVLWYRRARSKPFLFFALMFAVSLLPVMNVYGLDMTTADRWLYLPAIGFWGAVLVVLFSATQSRQRLRYVLISGLVIISVLYGVRSLARQQNWSSGYALFGHDIQYVHGSFELMDNYAAELIKRGEYAVAIPYLEESIRLNPNWYRTRTNLGVAYQFLGDDEKAEEAYLDTIRNYPTPFAYANLITLYYNRGDYGGAEDVIQEGLERYPNFNRLHFLRVLVLFKTDRQDEALTIMQQLLDKQALDRDIREFILQLDTIPPVQ